MAGWGRCGAARSIIRMAAHRAQSFPTWSACSVWQTSSRRGEQSVLVKGHDHETPLPSYIPVICHRADCGCASLARPGVGPRDALHAHSTVQCRAASSREAESPLDAHDNLTSAGCCWMVLPLAHLRRMARVIPSCMFALSPADNRYAEPLDTSEEATERGAWPWWRLEALGA